MPDDAADELFRLHPNRQVTLHGHDVDAEFGAKDLLGAVQFFFIACADGNAHPAQGAFAPGPAPAHAIRQLSALPARRGRSSCGLRTIERAASPADGAAGQQHPFVSTMVTHVRSSPSAAVRA